MKRFSPGISTRVSRRSRNILRRLARAVEILRTPYRNLVFDDDLNYRNSESESLDIRLISEEGSLKLLEIGDVRLYWPTAYDSKDLVGLYTDTFSPKDCNPHSYEMDDVLIQPGDWVVDAGACEGFFTMYALSRGANVLMIEPVSRLAGALSQTFKKEMKTGRVRLLVGAVGAQTGVTNIAIPEGGPIASSIDPGWKVNNSWELNKTSGLSDSIASVKVYRLDDILEDGIIPTIDFLKMDIENAEVVALQGATKLLSEIKPKLSIAVYHEYLNAQTIRSHILNVQPKYKVKCRGIFIRESFGCPRPYMLYANI